MRRSRPGCNTRTGAIVGRATADRFKWKIGDRIPLQSPIWGQPAGQTQWEFEIVGIYDGAKKGTDTSQFFFRYDYFEEARQQDKGQVGWYTVRIADPDQAAEIAAKIDAEFANSPYETKTEPEGAFAQGFAQQIGDIGSIVMAVVGAVFFTILLVAGNTMAQSVRERTEELGVLKAMGFTNVLVLVLVLLESCCHRHARRLRRARHRLADHRLGQSGARIVAGVLPAGRQPGRRGLAGRGARPRGRRAARPGRRCACESPTPCAEAANTHPQFAPCPI